ncbi:MAG: WbqC family protein [Spirosomataceae bacterium]
MQPYIFPYIGYFQLMQAADVFVVYDDVNFINRGWVNRNRLLANHKEWLFTIPLAGGSQNKKINEIQLDDAQPWRNKLLKTIEQNYRKAPHYQQVYPLIEQVVAAPTQLLSELLLSGLTQVANYLQLSAKIVPTSSVYQNQSLKAQERILDICAQEQATDYVNAIGGMSLYQKEDFAHVGIRLHFQRTRSIQYSQFGNDFVPWLSIIDVLMFNPIEQTRHLLTQYDLI